MLDRLPELIDPLVFAERRIELKGKLKLSVFTRLEGLLLDTDGDVAVELFFNKQGRHAFVDGWARTTLNMQCQNCLDAVSVPIAATIKLGMISAMEYADQLPEGYEPLLIDEEKMLLKDIVEDELILTLPHFPKHDYGCIKFEHPASVVVPPAENDADLKPKNPFAILANFKPTGDK